jgi:outer membrane protein assembly factor BamA
MPNAPLRYPPRSAFWAFALFWLACSVAAGGVSAQDAPPAEAPDTTQEAGEQGNTLIPLPVIFYTPETGFGFGLAASYYVRLSDPPADEPDAVVQPSLFQFFAVYTSKSQIVTQLSSNLFLSGTQYRSFSELGYAKFPTRFWGIGNDTPEDAGEDYTPVQLGIMTADFQRELKRGWYAGLAGRAVRREIKEVEEGGLLDSGEIPGSDDGWMVGLGLVGTRDTRESTTFPTSGSFHQVRGTYHGSALGSDFDFGSYLLDLRRYFSVGSRKVVALRATGMARSGSAPFDFLPQLGGDSLLRGYFQGRFTDRQLMAFQAEFRGPLWWRFAWVGFGAAGQVADDWGGFAMDGFKTSVGGGLRILINKQETLFIRADYGLGLTTGSSGFYLSIGEAF